MHSDVPVLSYCLSCLSPPCHADSPQSKGGFMATHGSEPSPSSSSCLPRA